MTHERLGIVLSWTKSEYKPFPGIEGYSTQVDTKTGSVRLLTFQDKNSGNGYRLVTRRPIGFVPKAGLLLAPSIEGYVQGKRVLDLGTGETGVLAIHSATYGASEVVGVDIDRETVQWASYNGRFNELTQTRWKISDLFSNIEEREFGVVVSNPPQMPMREGSVHDWGGRNGREIIERIIKESPNYLIKSGHLFMVLFDFLGVDTSYGDMPSLQEIFQAYGFTMEVIKRVMRKVRTGGATEKSIDYILEQYPQYKFRSHDNALFNEMLVIKAKLQ